MTRERRTKSSRVEADLAVPRPREKIRTAADLIRTETNSNDTEQSGQGTGTAVNAPARSTMQSERTSGCAAHVYIGSALGPAPQLSFSLSQLVRPYEKSTANRRSGFLCVSWSPANGRVGPRSFSSHTFQVRCTAAAENAAEKKDGQRGTGMDEKRTGRDGEEERTTHASRYA